jgi:hypothetical protein
MKKSIINEILDETIELIGNLKKKIPGQKMVAFIHIRIDKNSSGV